MMETMVSFHLMEYPDVLQPWYANDGVMYGAGSHFAPCFKELPCIGPMFGYHPEVTRSIDIYALTNQLRLKAIFLAMDLPFPWKRGSWYVGGQVGLIVMCLGFIEPKVTNWMHFMEALVHITVKYPQSVYTGLMMSL